MARKRNKKGEGWKEDGIKKERRTERKKEFWGKGGKEKKSLVLALNWSGQFCSSSPLLNGKGWSEGLVSLFSLPEPHSSLLFSL